MGRRNGFNRTLADEWAYAQLYTSNQALLAALAGWLHHYNSPSPPYRPGPRRSPMQLLNNLPGNYN